MTTTETLGATTFSTPSDRELAITRVLDAPRALVWEAWTSPEHLPRWMIGVSGWEMDVCEVDLRPGGRWRYGWRRPDGGEMRIQGEYREIEPPERLVATESWGEGWPETVGTLELVEEDGRTTLTQTVLYPSQEARDKALGSGMKQGMAKNLDRLAEHLATPD